MTDKKLTLKEKLFELQNRGITIGKNAEAGKDAKWWYKYATLDKIWEVIRPVMHELGIVESSAIKYNDSWKVFVFTTIYNIDNPDDYMSSLFPLDDTLSPQDMWKVITYGRRYNLVALLNLIIVWEDDDAQGVGKKSAPNGDKFVDTVIKNEDVEKAKTLQEKVSNWEYSLSPKKAEALVDFIDSNS